jgi:hypothetical protein
MRHREPTPHPRRHLYLGAAAVAVVVLLAAGTALAMTDDDPRSPTPAARIGAEAVAPAQSAGTEPAPSASGATATGAGDQTAGPSAAAPTRPASAAPPPAAVAAGPARFTTLGAGAALPSGAQCATWVRAKPTAENKGGNRQANQTVGHRIDAAQFSIDDPRAVQRIAPRIDGNFTGSTRDVLRWAACKWGFDENVVFAQAAVESWWRQNTKGDWTGNAANCAPGHGLGADGTPGQCPESFGIVQTRYPYMKWAWPGIGQSTAMVADVGYAIMRGCFEGYEGWLNTVERGRQYAAGDLDGCLGRYFSGRWHTAAGDQYLAKVQGYQQQRIWETRDFQEP